MDKAETGKIFTLLRQFYPHAAAAKEEYFRYAWELALRPYSYDDVRASALRYATREKFFPDLADLTEGLRREDAEEGRDDGSSHMIPYIIALCEQCGRKDLAERARKATLKEKLK